MQNKTMKAIMYDKYGPASVLYSTEIPVPTISRSELLIKIEATTVTSGDVRMRSSDFPPLFYIPGRLVLVLPNQKTNTWSWIGGHCYARGDDVKQFNVGEVYGTTSGLSRKHAEFIVAGVEKKTCVLVKCREHFFVQAASVPIGGMSLIFLLWDWAKPSRSWLSALA